MIFEASTDEVSIRYILSPDQSSPGKQEVNYWEKVSYFDSKYIQLPLQGSIAGMLSCLILQPAIQFQDAVLLIRGGHEHHIAGKEE